MCVCVCVYRECAAVVFLLFRCAVYLLVLYVYICAQIGNLYILCTAYIYTLGGGGWGGGSFVYGALCLRFGQGSCAIEMSIVVTVAIMLRTKVVKQSASRSNRKEQPATESMQTEIPV